MFYPESLVSIRTESQFLGGLIKNPKFLVEMDSFVSEKLFYHKIHKTCFSILSGLVYNGKEVNRVILAEQAKQLGINQFEDINLFEYLDSISFTNVNLKGLEELSGELLKLSIRRELWDNTSAIQHFIKENGDRELDELINGVDGIYGSMDLNYKFSDYPKDVYADIESIIHEIAKNPIEETGLKTPFELFNKWFGGLCSGDGVYVTTGSSGGGKSCYLFNMAKGTAELNNCKALVLDTEMSFKMNMFRAASAGTQVNQWFLKTGNWIKRDDLSKKVSSGLSKLKEYKGSIYHQYIPNKEIKEVLSMAKRWYYKECGKGNPAIIIYDYLKITSDLDKNRQEWQQLGDKISYLNELGHELNIPIYTGAQQNRTAFEANGARRDDSTTVGGSDRIQQYSCFNSIFREKTLEEISEHGNSFGTHVLIPIKSSRTSGVDNFDLNKNVEIIDSSTGKKKWKRNFLCYEISNYLVSEKGCYGDVVKSLGFNKPLQKEKKENSIQI